jgi:hypothetical protein
MATIPPPYFPPIYLFIFFLSFEGFEDEMGEIDGIYEQFTVFSFKC